MARNTEGRLVSKKYESYMNYNILALELIFNSFIGHWYHSIYCPSPIVLDVSGLLGQFQELVVKIYPYC